MFTLFDLCDLCSQDEKLTHFSRKYGLLKSKSPKCPRCEAEVGGPVEHQGKKHWRCKRRGCQKLIPCTDGSLTEGSKLNLKEILHLFYLWAHDCGGTQSVEMLGFGTETVAAWTHRLRLCVMGYEEAHHRPIGGANVEVECDETEIGRRQKGVHGHKKVVKGYMI